MGSPSNGRTCRSRGRTYEARFRLESLDVFRVAPVIGLGNFGSPRLLSSPHRLEKAPGAPTSWARRIIRSMQSKKRWASETSWKTSALMTKQVSFAFNTSRTSCYYRFESFTNIIINLIYNLLCFASSSSPDSTPSSLSSSSLSSLPSSSRSLSGKGQLPAHELHDNDMLHGGR